MIHSYSKYIHHDHFSGSISDAESIYQQLQNNTKMCLPVTEIGDSAPSFTLSARYFRSDSHYYLLVTNDERRRILKSLTKLYPQLSTS